MFNSLSVLTLAFKRVRDRLRSTSTLSIHLVFILGLLSLGCQSAGGPGLTLGGSGGSTGGNVYLDGGDGAGSDAGASGATGDEGAIDLGDGEAGGESGSDGSAEEEVSGGSGEAMPPVSIPAPGPMMNGALVAAAADASGNVPVFTTSNPWEASNFEGKQVIVSIDALEEVVFFNQNKTQKLAKNINKKLNDWTTKLFNPAHAITPWGAGTEGHYRANVTRQVALKTDWIPVVHFDDYDVDYDEVEAPSGAGDIEDELAELADRPEFCDAEENYGYIHCCEEQVNVDGTFSCVFPYGDIDADLYENINLHVYLLDGDEIVEGPYQEAPNRNLLWLNRAPQQIAGASTALGHRIHALTQGAVAEIEVEVDAELGTIHKVSGDHTKAYAVAGIAADNAAGLAVSSAGKVALLNRVVDGEDVSTPVDLYADLRRQGADDGENNFDDAVRVEPFSREFTKFKYLSYQDEDLLMVNFVNDDPHPMNKLAYIDSNNIVSEFFMPSVDEARSHKELIASDVQYHDGFETTFGVMILIKSLFLFRDQHFWGIL